jgi:uncharacterized BrkB/YihY/UPF0761 family membrane protein
MALTDMTRRDRRITVAITIVMVMLALPLVVVSGVVLVDVLAKLPHSRAEFFPLSFVLTFALFFAAMAWRGFASIGRTGPALTVQGWRLLAGAFVVVGVVGAIGHRAGLVLPLLVAVLCLYNDPAVARVLQWIGLSV